MKRKGPAKKKVRSSDKKGAAAEKGGGSKWLDFLRRHSKVEKKK